MQTLFDLVPRSLQGIQHPPTWPYVKRGLLANVSQVIRYYRGNPQAVKGDHLLVRLIQSIDIPLSMEYERYFDNVDATSLNHATVLKLTSSLAKGQVWDGVFYGPGNQEILVAHRDDFDVDLIRRDWQNATPVRVLRHAKSDLNLNLPDGRRNTTESGICVVSINVPLLMCQYYWFRQSYWIDDTVRHSDAVKIDPRSVMMFIHMYVLPNMLFSHLDQALMNRITKAVSKEPMGQVITRHPFALIDYSQKVDQVQKEVLVDLAGREMNLVGVLETIPAVARESMEEELPVPDMALTRQVAWALAISRLPMIGFALNQAHYHPGTKNQAEINNINRTFMRWKMANYFQGTMPSDMYVDVIKELNAILQEGDPSQDGWFS